MLLLPLSIFTSIYFIYIEREHAYYTHTTLANKSLKSMNKHTVGKTKSE
jgi:hypothetical protein